MNLTILFIFIENQFITLSMRQHPVAIHYKFVKNCLSFNVWQG